MRRRSFNWAVAVIFLTTLLFLFSSFQYLSEQKLRKHDAAVSFAHQADLEAKFRELQKALLQEHENAEALQQAAQHSSDGFAYVFYATSNDYACSVLVNVHRLQNDLNSTIPIHVLISDKLDRVYIDQFHAADVTVHLETPPPLTVEEGFYYEDCLLKLLAFKMHKLAPSLKRVLVFDSDQLILKNMDQLFSGLPPIDLAAPHAYWLNKDFLASTFMMINLSDRLWELVQGAIKKDYDERQIKMDMDLVNDLLGDTAMFLSGEYVTLNSHWETWSLPKWYHPAELRHVTVEEWNKLVEQMDGVEAKDEVGEVRWLRQTADTRDHDGSIVSAGSTPTAPTASASEIHATDNAVDNSNVATSQKEAPSADPQPSDNENNSPTSESEDEPEPEPEPVEPVPRFPSYHPIFKDLEHLYHNAPVIHFTAGGKPWMSTSAQMAYEHPYAHPLLADQVATWRTAAKAVCPGWADEPV